MKKNIFNVLFVCAAGLLAIVHYGCSDMLDQQPQGEWVKGDETGGSFQADVFTMYAKMRGYNMTGGLGALLVHSVRSEDMEKGSTSSDGSSAAAMFDDFDYNAADGNIKGYWTDNYAIINIANRVLADLADFEAAGNTLSEGDLQNQSETYFFRAYCYFNLVRAFGEVPKIDFKVTDAAQTNVPKSSVNDIYALIDSDLTAAEQHLPKTWPAIYIGRLTWGAARSLHARTYMQRNDWQNMYTAATEVMQSGVYNLNTAYDQIFRETGENCSESVLELQCTATAALPASGDIGSQFANVQGVRGAGSWDLGWGWNTPTQEMADAFEAGDPRKDETLLYFLRSSDDPNSIQPNKPYNDKPVAQDAVINKYYNKKVYTNPALRTQFGNRFGYWFNIRLIRYSDVVLMAAESANELGKTSEAIDYLEMVRARARGTNASVLPKITTNLQQAIRHERRVELGAEFDRFYDLVRWGVAEQVLHAAGKTKYQDRNKYFPLPQDEVDKSNGVLKQNPNY